MPGSAPPRNTPIWCATPRGQPPAGRTVTDLAALYLEEQFEVRPKSRSQQRVHGLLWNRILPGLIRDRCSPMTMAAIKKLRGHTDIETTSLLDWHPSSPLPRLAPKSSSSLGSAKTLGPTPSAAYRSHLILIPPRSPLKGLPVCHQSHQPSSCVPPPSLGIAIPASSVLSSLSPEIEATTLCTPSHCPKPIPQTANNAS